VIALKPPFLQCAISERAHYASLVTDVPATTTTTIHDAVRKGDLEEFKALLKDNPELVFSKDNAGRTPLHWATVSDNNAVAQVLLANKAEVNAKANDGVMPLHFAAQMGHKNGLELLRQHGGH